ncbi:type IV toxin-antitoxin system AbiEi family antitoxin [Serratia marcescens]|uniref:type IV toxin-antitoxin system AbiEi family antitoxin n=1 Tax=Serratia marcescens TaxID=615 RepID=UPI003EDB014E
MDKMTAINTLDKFSRLGKHIFLTQDLATLFPAESPKTLQKSVDRLVAASILKRVAKGVYANARASLGGYPLESIAINLRRGEYNYISLESALSQYGVISQIPIDRLTIMSTGRSGEFVTPWGVIEITHTSKKPIDILRGSLEGRGPLRIATKETAIKDLFRVGRNTHLIQQGELADV